MQYQHDRRRFLTAAGAIGAGGVVGAAFTHPASADPVSAHPPIAAPPGTTDPWRAMRRIVAGVRRPRFPRRSFDIRRFGAVSGTDCSDAISRAIGACHHAGGGRVIVPPGDYLTGPIHLRSRVELHLSEGSRLRFSTDPSDYLPLVVTRFEGVELYNYSPLIYAYQQNDIAITGSGTLDGQAGNDHWWPWKGHPDYGWHEGDPSQATAREALFAQAEQGVPVSQRTFGEGACLRPSFIEPYRCQNVLIEGVTVINSPMWQVHPTLCTNVLVHEVTVRSHGPNNDGCDPESTRNMIISNCRFDTGDDCIAIKSGRDADGRRLAMPSEDILIAGCTMADGHGGVTIGSEMSGGVRNVFVDDCTLSSPNLDKALRFKTNSRRGGFISDVHIRDTKIGTVGGNVLDIDLYYEDGPGHGHNPEVGGITIKDVQVDQANRAIYLRGYPDDPIRDVRLTDVDFGRTAETSLAQSVVDLSLRDVQENGEPLNEVPAG